MFLLITAERIIILYAFMVAYLSYNICVDKINTVTVIGTSHVL